jgi:hypothetical protein
MEKLIKSIVPVIMCFRYIIKIFKDKYDVEKKNKRKIKTFKIDRLGFCKAW